ncbi:MAG: PaaI family thioesterase, partial [Pseudomonadota bacterium]
EHLIGDPKARVIHGGVITTMLDSLCGMACAVTLKELQFVATLDLRIDYMRPADTGRDIIGEAECYHVTKSVAFTRAWAYHESRDKVIATAQAAFAINKPRPTVSLGVPA